VCFLLRFGG